MAYIWNKYEVKFTGQTSAEILAIVGFLLFVGVCNQSKGLTIIGLLVMVYGIYNWSNKKKKAGTNNLSTTSLPSQERPDQESSTSDPIVEGSPVRKPPFE